MPIIHFEERGYHYLSFKGPLMYVASKLRKLQQFQKWQKMGQKSPISEHKTPKTREIIDIFKKSFKPELRVTDYTILPNFSLIGAFLWI